jgi:stearoyl-CoA desaturase (delta-9 desaturase)
MPLSSGPDLSPYPWERPWYLPVPGAWPTFLWVVLIHLTAIAGVILFPLPGWRIILGAIALAWIGGVGTTVGYHRAIAHRSLRLTPVVRNILTFFAMFNGSGSPLSWAANHRHHHAHSDTPKDISSPRVAGFWWSHLRWLWQAGPAPEAHYCRDLNEASYRWWGRAQVLVLALSYFGGLAFGWAGFFWLGAIRLVYSLHAQCFVNSVCHLGAATEVGEDSSKNVWWLGLWHLFQGENWHHNHHARPGSAKFGWGRWQIDTGWLIILALKRLRLASNVRAQEAQTSS